jgi:hypothetical protein
MLAKTGILFDEFVDLGANSWRAFSSQRLPRN